ncbi:MAG: hydrogenase maturation nickel metallochaperone HypA [Clostridiales Family XIII bacterium]|jgi:hydrogenase nickel incorporation protein HypA/HybF|nr:hydrogenase maturation nickel metallochaperone HypA [Clostridiales Family XIII bacterium]
MHEYPITENIIRIAEKHGQDYRAPLVIDGNRSELLEVRVTLVNLVIGDNSGIIPESVHMYFDLIAAGTIVEGAELSIERVKSRLKCPNCGELFIRKPMSFACPKCGADGHPTEIGKEFYIDSIEVSSS